jgi:murein DD-endopeptidase MepM/ murein hydrolase activator NlpD
MTTERSHRKKNHWNYHIVLLPHEDTGKSRSFRIALWGLALSLVIYALAIAALTVFFLKWTPLGVWIPVKNPELERRYGKEVTVLHERLSRIVAELDVLQRYNAKLRQALGSDLRASDNEITAAAQSKTLQDQPQLSPPEKERTSEPSYATDETLNPPSSLPYSRAAIMFPTADAGSFQKNLPLRLPVGGYVTQGFQPSLGHLGIDIAGKQGSSIAAAADGYIVFAGWTYDAGNMIIIAHGGGYFTFYKHNQALLKSAHSLVKSGEPIALLGNTGAMSHGPHLHFEVWKDGIARDPSEYVLNFHLY